MFLWITWGLILSLLLFFLRCVMLKSWRKVSLNIRSKSSSWWSLCSSSTFMMISFMRLKWLIFSIFSSLMVNPCWYLEVYNAFRLFEMQFTICKEEIHNFTPDLHWFTFKNLNKKMHIWVLKLIIANISWFKWSISKEWEHLLLNKINLL